MAKHYVSCELRFDTEEERNELYAQIKAKEAKIDKEKTVGYIRKHLCRHDEGLSCENEEKTEWGAYNGRT